MENQETLSTRSDFEASPRGMAERWQAEMKAADKETADWLRESEKIVDRLLDRRNSTGRDGVARHRLNFFSANIQTMRAMLYGNLPSIDVKRRFDDAQDDVARVAANILERMLNADVQRDDDDYTDVLRYCLDDHLTVGQGVARVRYEADFEQDPVAGPDGQPMIGEDGKPMLQDRKVWEDAPTDYVGWRDVRWSPARVWGEVRWIAFRAWMTKDAVTKRFGERVAKKVPYGSDEQEGRKRGKHEQASKTDSLNHDPWQRAAVWEIWCKEDRKVYWYVEGMDEVLDHKPDPLKIEGFWPCPKFMIANETTSSLVPRPDFILHRDLYNEIDFVSTRIERLERAVKAVGVYDKNSDGVQRLMTEAVQNQLIPVDNWAGFSEKGGLQGAVQWLPLADIVNALTVLRDYRREMIELLNQLTGMSDILRGAASQPNVTATEQGLKARYSSVRITAKQDMFSEFASELQRIRAQVIVNHFDDETIIARSNIMNTPDAQYAGPALEFLRSKYTEFRVSILPDNIARADYAVTKSERTEFITAISQYLQQAMPMAQQIPGSAPALLEMMKWMAAGFRGGQQIETVLDEAIKQLEQQGGGQQGQQQGPSEDQLKLQIEQLKQQGQAQKLQAQMQMAQMKAQQEQQELMAKQQADRQQLQAEHQTRMAQIQAELQADIERERTQAQYNALENKAKTEAAIEQAKQVARFQTRAAS
jgi:hypothetical protein